jgi:hypothetical protein
MSPAVLLALAAVYQLERVPLNDCVRRSDEVVCRFAAPARLAERQVRLRADCADLLKINGIAVQGSGQPRVISGLLAGRGGNEAAGPAGCLPLELLVTPRVYIASGQWQAAPAGLRILVDNALDNTVNVGLACRAEGAPGPEWRASGTVAASASMEFIWSLTVSPADGARLVCLLEKQPESVEESYAYRWVYIFHTLTENGSPKHR